MKFQETKFINKTNHKRVQRYRHQTKDNYKTSEEQLRKKYIKKTSLKRR